MGVYAHTQSHKKILRSKSPVVYMAGSNKDVSRELNCAVPSILLENQVDFLNFSVGQIIHGGYRGTALASIF